MPADDLSYGFDNIADVLSLSPSLLERYMLAAGKIAELAVGQPSIRATTATYSTSPVLLQHARMSELHPFGTRGGVAMRHYFPVAGVYEIRITLERTHGDAIKGLQRRNRLEVRLDRARVAEFEIGADGQREAWNAGVTLTPDEYLNKGPHRPAFPGQLRAEAIAALCAERWLAEHARWYARPRHGMRTIMLASIVFPASL